MSTNYVVFCETYDDPVWGEQVLDWSHTGLVRVYRNRVLNAVFEWVGCPSEKFDLDEVRRKYPVCRLAKLPQEHRTIVLHRNRIPFPDRTHRR